MTTLFSVTWPSLASVSSWGITASAPGGSGAPVKIRIASPAATARDGIAPAVTVPTTLRRTGARAASCCVIVNTSVTVVTRVGVLDTGRSTIHTLEVKRLVVRAVGA